jgi:hypothetical protein
MEGLIDRIADFISSVINKKADTALDRGRRREVYILIAVFLFTVFGMGIYAVYSLIKMIIGK